MIIAKRCVRDREPLSDIAFFVFRIEQTGGLHSKLLQLTAIGRCKKVRKDVSCFGEVFAC